MKSRPSLQQQVTEISLQTKKTSFILHQKNRCTLTVKERTLRASSSSDDPFSVLLCGKNFSMVMRDSLWVG